MDYKKEYKLPDDCVRISQLKNQLKKNLNRDAELIEINTICVPHEGGKVYIIFRCLPNKFSYVDNLIENVISNHHPIKLGKKFKIKPATRKNRFQKIEFERQNNGRFIAHVYMGKKGLSKKLHIFKEPSLPQRIEATTHHLSTKEGFIDEIGFIYMAISAENNDFHACLTLENTDIIRTK